MRLRQTGHGVHEVTFHSWKLPLFLAGFSIYFAYVLVQNMIFGSTERNPIIGPLIGFIFTGFGAAMFYERGQFIFDVTRGMVTWHRTGVAGIKNGRFAFDAIRGIRLETQPGGHESGKRIVIETDAGIVPMTRAYYGQGLDKLQSIVDHLTDVVIGRDENKEISQRTTPAEAKTRG